MNIKEAIELLKDYRKGDFVDDYKLCEAIDTVVEYCEQETYIENTDCILFGKCGFAVSNYPGCWKNCKHFKIKNTERPLPTDEEINLEIENLSSKNIANKIGLDDILREKSTEQTDNQESLSNKKDRIYTDKEMETFAEWCAENGWSVSIKKHRWVNDNGEGIYTSQLRELWEQERRSK